MDIRYLYIVALPVTDEPGRWDDLFKKLSFMDSLDGMPVEKDHIYDKDKTLGKRFSMAYERISQIPLNCSLIKDGRIKKAEELEDCILERIFVSHNRFQEYLYFQYVLRISCKDGSPSRCGTDDILKLKEAVFEDILEHAVNSFSEFSGITPEESRDKVRDSFPIIIKIPKGYKVKEQDYINNLEYMALLNPAPIIIDSEQPVEDITGRSESRDLQGSETFCFKYDPGYSDRLMHPRYLKKLDIKGSSRVYCRLQRNEYYIQGSEQETQPWKSLNDAVKHYTNSFLMFHRSFTMQAEISQLDEYLEILGLTENDLSNSWAFGRIELMASGLFRNWAFDNTLFNIFETNTQINTANAKLKLHYKNIKEKYDLQFERALFNNKDHGEHMTEYYQELMSTLTGYINSRINAVDSLIVNYAGTQQQIADFRENNNTRINSCIQQVMSVLTFLTLSWGIFIAVSENITDRRLPENLPLFTDKILYVFGAAWPVILCSGIILFSVFILFFWLRISLLKNYIFDFNTICIIKSMVRGRTDMHRDYEKALQIIERWEKKYLEKGKPSLLTKNKLYQGILVLVIYDIHDVHFSASPDVRQRMLEIIRNLSQENSLI